MNRIEENSALLVSPQATIRDALKQIDANREGILFVTNKAVELQGAITDGDIRRSLLAGKSLTDSIEGTYNPAPISILETDFDIETARQLLVQHHVEVLPILNEARCVVGYIAWDDLLKGVERKPMGRAVDVPVVIMAGGKGTRMAPFTNVLPKPLVPIGDKTILELIIDSFRAFQIKDFYFTINYRGEMIRAYFDCIEKDYQVTYLKEKDFWGTAGSLSLLVPGFAKTFIVSNCDIIVQADYAEVLDFHRSSGAMLTVLSSIQHYKIPYGVIKFEAGGRVLEIEEKPEMSFCINTGVYVLEAECLNFIPHGEVFHMTHLMEKLMAAGHNVSTYPVNEKEYVDVGQWGEYHKALADMESGLK